MTKLNPWEAERVEQFVEYLVKELKREEKFDVWKREFSRVLKDWLYEKQTEFLQENEEEVEEPKTDMVDFANRLLGGHHDMIRGKI